MWQYEHGDRTRFAFLPLAKIKVATSVCTGGRYCPPDSSTAMGSSPRPLPNKKERQEPNADKLRDRWLLINRKNSRYILVIKIFYQSVSHFAFSFAVLIEEMSILRIDPQSCNTAFATSQEIMLAFWAISIQYSVS